MLDGCLQRKPFPFSLTAPKCGVGGGGRGGIPASFPSRSPPPKQPSQPTPTPSPGSQQEVCEKIELGGFCGEKAPGLWWAGPQALGARAPSPLETWPTGPWGLDPATLPVDFLQAKLVSEGGAVGSRLRSSISAAGPGPKPLGTWPTSP